MVAAGVSHLRPFWHEDMGKWAESMHFGAEGRFHCDHPETNIRFGGGLDDVWENIETGELHIVDYKSTAQLGKQSKPLDESFIAAPLDASDPTTKSATAGRWICTNGLLDSSVLRCPTLGILFMSMGSIERSPGCWTVKIPQQAWMRF